jgi:hypothetical protein
MSEPSAAERLHRLAAGLVVDCFMSEMHDHDKGPRELDRLTKKFEQKLLAFAVDEITRHKKAYTL